jgi:multidrug efflux system membrane fusion protein
LANHGVDSQEADSGIFMRIVSETPPARSRRTLLWVAGIAVVLIAAAVATFTLRSKPQARATAQQPVPVTVAPVAQQDVAIFLHALGTVQASYTVSVRSQIDGKLQAVNFVEGQAVHRGDTLAQIDPRALQAVLDQAVAKKAQDAAQLVAAEKDLARFKELGRKAFETQQNIDQQQAKVDQFKASIDADQAAIESAQTQLSYATITAPIDGRAGFRQVDPGNIIHANDQNPLTVLTLIRPVNAIFTLPQENLTEVREAMLQGAVPVFAFDQNNALQLAQGELLLIDNQIDQTTSTIRLKGRFRNDDERLWPGEFVHLRIEVDTRQAAVTIPPVALQRGPNGFYTWVIKPDGTAEQRPIEASPVNDNVTIVTKGLAAGERVVVNGQYRLQPGSPVEAKIAQASNNVGGAP